MKKLFFAFALVACFAVSALSQGAPPWTIQEIDGSPRVNSPTLIKVTNGTLSCTGKTCTITISGGGGGSPGGSSTQVQYNAAGSFGGISGFTSDGTNVTAGSGNLRATSPRITTGINDSNGNELILFTATASAVNEFTIANAATGGNPTFSATGDDADINIRISPKGAGGVVLSNGTAANAGLRFASDATSVGWYRTAQSWTYTYVGTTQFALPAEGIRLSNGIALTFSTGSAESSGSDTRLVRTGTNTIRLANATTGAGNLIIGTSAGAIGTSGAGVLAFTLSTEPSTSPTDTTQLYYKDFAAGDGRLYLRNEASAAGSPVANLGDAQTFTGRITFSPGATVAGVNVGSLAGDPSTPSNGDLWYDSSSNELTARINGANVALGSGGGSGANPTASVGLTAVNGVATTFMRSDAAPALDQAITPTWTGAHIWSGVAGTFRRDNIGTTSTDGLVVENTTTTTGSGLNQWSPRLRFRGTGWKTAATAGSQTVDYALEVQTSDEVSNPNSEFVIRYSVNGGAYSNLFRLGRTGTLTLSSGAVITGTSFQTEAGGAGFRVNNRARLVSPAVGVWQLYGDQASTSATLSSVATTPTQITADQNNYAPGVAWFQRWSSDASRNVTGLVSGQDGQLAEIWNVGSNNIVLVHESASSTAANRFTTSTGADLTLTAGKCAIARYDTTSTRWRVYLCN